MGHPVCINKTLQENMYMYIPICTLGVICYIQKYKILILSIFLWHSIKSILVKSESWEPFWKFLIRTFWKGNKMDSCKNRFCVSTCWKENHVAEAEMINAWRNKNREVWIRTAESDWWQILLFNIDFDSTSLKNRRKIHILINTLHGYFTAIF